MKLRQWYTSIFRLHGEKKKTRSGITARLPTVSLGIWWVYERANWVERRRGSRLLRDGAGIEISIFPWNDSNGTKWSIQHIPPGDYRRFDGTQFQDWNFESLSRALDSHSTAIISLNLPLCHTLFLTFSLPLLGADSRTWFRALLLGSSKCVFRKGSRAF